METIYIKVTFTNDGVGVTGLTPTVSVASWTTSGIEKASLIHENAEMRELEFPGFEGTYIFPVKIANKFNYIWSANAGTDAVDERILISDIQYIPEGQKAARLNPVLVLPMP